jgi:filamentous hemagglutinin family protein
MNHTYGYHKRGVFALKGLAASLLLAFGSSVHALPSGGAVSAGGATIAGGGGTLTINQSTQNVAINWQSFSIAPAEAVRFVQPNSSSVALNRVVGVDPSSIMGSLSANGKVFLVNPNGILFAQGAQVNVGGLVASTRGISDNDFMAGNYRFSGSGGGTVVNRGSINADGGYVALLGANVSNEGVISARLGTVALAAGNAITLDVAGDGLLNVAVNQGAVDALAQNGGLIRAGGGQVLLTALSAGNLIQSAVNNTGMIQAQTVENRNGVIRLLGDMQSGTVSVAGTLDASGTGPGQTGGSITVAGHHVGLFNGHINASGDAGGGMVLVGGGYQGNNPAVPNASAAYMSANSTINVDAITNGNGGTAVLWSNDSTRAHGSITARGGALGGNGGLIETSGHALDVFGIGINASAPNGKNGLWLLDPADVTITAAGGTTNGSFNGGNPNVFSPSSGAAVTTVDRDALQVILGVGGLGTDVTITTTNTGAAGNGAGDITVASAITWTPTNFTTLTLNAARDVHINAPVTTTLGNLVVCCGRDINVNAAIVTDGVVATLNSGGNVLLSAGRDVNILRTALNIGAGITTTSGNMEICSGRDINLSNTGNGAALLTLTGSVGDSLPPNGPVTPRGMTLIAGTGGTGPGAAGGTLNIAGGTIITVTGPAGISPINIVYNPVSYLAPTDYTGFFATGNGGPHTQFMLVFPEAAAKTADGTTAATFIGLKGSPAGVTLNTAGGTANFDTAAAGTGLPISFTGFTLTQGPIVAGGLASNFALPTTCCGPIVGRTTGTITAGTTATTTPASTLQTMPLLPFLGLPLLAGLDLSVLGGITMPPIPVAEAAPEETAAVAAAIPPPPPVVVPRPLPPRQTRH